MIATPGALFRRADGSKTWEKIKITGASGMGNLVITDDVNLPLGRLRARARGSEGGHNGLRSIIEQLGTNEFPRLRVGVGRGDSRRDLADHVLARFEPDEHAEIDRAILRAADAAEMFATDGIEKVMNLFNKLESAPESDAR